MSQPKTKKQLVFTPLESESSGRLLFIACFICYFVFCGTRNFYPQALTEIVPSGVFTKDIAGIVSSVYWISYGIGMFMNGFVCERVQPFRYVSVSLFISALANGLMFAFSYASEPSIWVFAVIWAVAGFAQSMTWPTLIRAVSTLMPEAKRASAGLNLYVASTASGIFVYLFSQQILRMFSWHELFLSAAVIGFALLTFWIISTSGISKKCCSYVESPVGEDKAPVKETAKDTSGAYSFGSLVIMSGAILIMCSVGFKALAYDGLAGWIPTMLTERFELASDMSVMISTMIPVCNLVGIFFGKLLLEKVFHSEVLAATVYLFTGVVGLAAAATFGFHSLIGMLLLLGAVIPVIAAASTMYISLVPLRFAKFGRSGTVAGMLNAAACACSGISSFMIGVLSQNFEWQITMYVLCGLMATGGVLSLINIRRFARFRRL